MWNGIRLSANMPSIVALTQELRKKYQKTRRKHQYIQDQPKSEQIIFNEFWKQDIQQLNIHDKNQINMYAKLSNIW